MGETGRQASVPPGRWARNGEPRKGNDAMTKRRGPKIRCSGAPLPSATTFGIAVTWGEARGNPRVRQRQGPVSRRFHGADLGPFERPGLRYRPIGETQHHL